jgi:Flp pilus assembly protein TadG
MSRMLVRAREDRGAAAVEFALVLPLLLLLIFGIVDFGRAWNMQLALTQAAREGVRSVALADGTDAAQRTRDAAFPVTGITVGITACPATVTASSDAQVTASRTYDYITPISGILNIIGQPSLAAPTITGRGRMRCNG